MRFLLCLPLLTVPLSASVAQTVPGDLDVVATAGGTFPNGSSSETVSVHVTADRSSTLTRYRSGLDGPPGDDPMDFALSQDALQQLWQSIESADLVVYDALGRHVAVLASSLHAAGTHSVRFEAAEHASGIYYYRLRTEGAVRSGKIVLVR